MYCSSCGAPLTTDVSYCNRCGAESNAKTKTKLGMRPETLVWAIVAVAILGIGADIVLMALLKESLRLENGLILGLGLLMFLPFLAIEAVFIWLLIRGLRTPREPRDSVFARSVSTNDLEAPVPRALQEPSVSVTENTTRSLDQIGSRRETI